MLKLWQSKILPDIVFFLFRLKIKGERNLKTNNTHKIDLLQFINIMILEVNDLTVLST